MKLQLSAKALGKKKSFIDQVIIDLEIASESNVSELLTKLVLQQVNAFNKKKDDNTLFNFLSESTISQSAQSGSVKFNEQYNDNKADESKAVSTVLQAFEDGLIALFINDEPLEISSQKINLKESDNITVVRLTFLTGLL